MEKQLQSRTLKVIWLTYNHVWAVLKFQLSSQASKDWTILLTSFSSQNFCLKLGRVSKRWQPESLHSWTSSIYWLNRVPSSLLSNWKRSIRREADLSRFEKTMRCKYLTQAIERLRSKVRGLSTNRQKVGPFRLVAGSISKLSRRVRSKAY